MLYNMKTIFLIAFSQLAAAAAAEQQHELFTVDGPNILRDGEAFVPFGTNAKRTQKPRSKRIDLLALEVYNVVREAIIMDEQPLRCHDTKKQACLPKKLCAGVELYPLETVLDYNAMQDVVTVVDLHQWNATTDLKGKIPSQVSFADQYLRKLVQDYVPFLQDYTGEAWLSLWNEPFASSVSPEEWMFEMERIVQAVRTAGYTGVLVLPVGQDGEDESVLMYGHAQALAQNYGPIVYDIHVNDRWLSSTAPMDRIEAVVHKEELAVLIGAVDPSSTEAHNQFIEEANVEANVGVVFGNVQMKRCPTFHFDEGNFAKQNV